MSLCHAASWVKRWAMPRLWPDPRDQEPEPRWLAIVIAVLMALQLLVVLAQCSV